MMDIVKLIIQTAKDVGPWKLGQVIQLLKANNISDRDMNHVLKKLRPYIL